MKDCELLELAAKAAGIRGKYNSITDTFYLAEDQLDPAGGGRRWWNPLTDGGDALWLAVKLKMQVAVWRRDTTAKTYTTDHMRVPHGNDIHAATRRAIVIAAAEIGKAKQ